MKKWSRKPLPSKRTTRGLAAITMEAPPNNQQFSFYTLYKTTSEPCRYLPIPQLFSSHQKRQNWLNGRCKEQATPRNYSVRVVAEIAECMSDFTMSPAAMDRGTPTHATARPYDAGIRTITAHFRTSRQSVQNTYVTIILNGNFFFFSRAWDIWWLTSGHTQAHMAVTVNSLQRSWLREVCSQLN